MISRRLQPGGARAHAFEHARDTGGALQMGCYLVGQCQLAGTVWLLLLSAIQADAAEYISLILEGQGAEIERIRLADELVVVERASKLGG